MTPQGTIQTGCFHPIHAIELKTVHGFQEGERMDFEIYMRCKICKQEIMMVAKGQQVPGKKEGEQNGEMETGARREVTETHEDSG